MRTLYRRLGEVVTPAHPKVSQSDRHQTLSDLIPSKSFCPPAGDDRARPTHPALHAASAAPQIRTYASTAARSSATSTYSWSVWATWIDPGPNRYGVPHRPSTGTSVA